MPESNSAHWPQQLSLCCRSWELQLLKFGALEPLLHNGGGHCDKKTAECNEE